MSSAESSPQFPTYEGWTNKPTWCVNLWLSNDEGLYHDIRRLAQLARRHQKDAGYLGETVKLYVEELCDDILSKPTFQADLMSWALAYVNWEEIAQAWLED